MVYEEDDRVLPLDSRSFYEDSECPLTRPFGKLTTAGSKGSTSINQISGQVSVQWSINDSALYEKVVFGTSGMGAKLLAHLPFGDDRESEPTLQWVGSVQLIIGGLSVCLFNLFGVANQLLAIGNEKSSGASSSSGNNGAKLLEENADLQWQVVAALLGDRRMKPGYSVTVFDGVHFHLPSREQVPIFQLSTRESAQYPALPEGKMVDGFVASVFSHCKVRNINCDLFLASLEYQYGKLMISLDLLKALEPIISQQLPVKAGVSFDWSVLLEKQGQGALFSHAPLYL